jgi:hypothetical protein
VTQRLPAEWSSSALWSKLARSASARTKRAQQLQRSLTAAQMLELESLQVNGSIDGSVESSGDVRASAAGSGDADAAAAPVATKRDASAVLQAFQEVRCCMLPTIHSKFKSNFFA